MSSVLPLEWIAMTEADRAAFLERVRPGVGPEGYRLIEALSHALPQILALIEQGPMTMGKLRHLIFGPKTEKIGRICPGATPPAPGPQTPSTKRKGHGRAKARDYTGAQWVQVAHPQLRAGDRCPHCAQGSVRSQSSPAMALRIAGAPPISATGYAMQRLRCDACGQVFTAPTPPEAGQEKYDESVGATVALLRYGCGMPHYRLARLQKSLGVPMPEATQWETLKPLAQQAQPIFEELTALAAQSPLMHHEDTTMRIVDLRRPGSATALQMDPQRKGTFTSNLLAYVEDHPVALYFTGGQQAGENLAALLRQRGAQLCPPIQMCDALLRNLSPEFDTLLAHCLSHGRREFVSLAQDFPEPCRHVLESLGVIYHVDAQAKALAMSPQQRWVHHQTYSQPVMNQLHAWMRQQMDNKVVEPNSGLGQAIGYMPRHWEPLTLFLRLPGAHLDNNISERALKMAILHRKNSLSYKTLNGARTGNLFMSLIHTCRLNGANPFDYLMAIARHPEAVKLIPKAWLPWNYPRSPAGSPTQ